MKSNSELKFDILSNNFYNLHHGEGKLYTFNFQLSGYFFDEPNIQKNLPNHLKSYFNASSQISMTLA